jgi:hypothetical protein
LQVIAGQAQGGVDLGRNVGGQIAGHPVAHLGAKGQFIVSEVQVHGACLRAIFCPVL